MSFLDIKDPSKKATIVNEHVTAMKTVKQRNMVNREMKLAIGDELQTLFHPIVKVLLMQLRDHHRIKMLILHLVYTGNKMDD